MPSHLHEMLIEMFRNRPSLAAELLDGPLRGDLPDYDEAHLSSADLTDVAPTEYRADAVVRLVRSGADVLAVVVEVQRRIDAQKRRSWPAYAGTLHARLGCPIVLMVICPRQSVADWAAEPILIGPPTSHIAPVAFGPDQTPVVTDPGIARRLPELAVLSVLAHAARPDPNPLFEALFTALDVIEPDRGALYTDLVLTVLPAAARKLLEDFMTTTSHPYQSDFARRYYSAGKADGMAEGRVEGRAEGRVEGEVVSKAQAVLDVLDARGLRVSAEARVRITECTDPEQLRHWIRRAATAERVQDLGGSLLA